MRFSTTTRGSGVNRTQSFLISTLSRSLPNTACASLTGWACAATFRGDAVISRTGWTNRTDTLLYFGSRTWYGDHDLPENGTVRIQKVGALLNIDSLPGLASGNGFDMTSVGDMIEFGGPRNSAIGTGGNYAVAQGYDHNRPGISPIFRWASSNHGVYDPAFGDQNSNYMYSCSDLKGAYIIPIDHAHRCVVHLKKPGTEEIIIQWDSVDVTSSPTQVATHLHYAQTGQPAYQEVTFNEGQTTCPGAGGCAALNVGRAIQSMEDGGTDANNPPRNFGILTHFLSPGTIALRDDSPVMTVSSVTKTVIAGITSMATGTRTSVQTAVPHGLIPFEDVTISGVTGTGICNGNGIVMSVPDSTHYIASIDTSTCVKPSGGASTSPTLFNAPSHGLTNMAAITSLSSGNQAAITTAAPHGLAVGQYLQISGVNSAGGSCDSINTAWNEGWIVSSVPDEMHATIVFNSTACRGQSGGYTNPYPPEFITISHATGDWAGINTYVSLPVPVKLIDPDHFGLISGNTSAYNGTFNGVVAGVYPGGYGMSHRVSVCAGASCGSKVSGFESLIVHKISQNLSDLTLTTRALNPDGNWTGVQTADKVVVVARGGITHGSMAAFSTTHSGVAQYLFGGLAAGIYAVTINGVGVAGTPFTVTDGDNSIEFESTAGTVNVSLLVPAPSTSPTAPTAPSPTSATPVSVMPSSGAGVNQTFAFVVSDSKGAAAISAVSVIIGTTLAPARNCYLVYYPGSRLLYLMNDAGAGWLGPISPGTNTSLQNSQCGVNAASTSITGSGSNLNANNLSVNLALSFLPAFGGPKNVYMNATDTVDSGWQQLGTWTVPSTPPTSVPSASPTSVSVTPNSGSGSSATFGFLVGDAKDSSAISSVSVILGPSPAVAGTCYVIYYPNANIVSLQNDAGTAWLGPASLGVRGGLQNRQCSLVSASSSVSGSGSGATLFLSLTFSFQPSYSGVKNIYVDAAGSVDSGWQIAGTWTIP